MLQNEAELRKVAALLTRQTHQLAQLVSPAAAIQRGAPADHNAVAVATADSVGLACYAIALLLVEVVNVLQPQTTPEGDTH